MILYISNLILDDIKPLFREKNSWSKTLSKSGFLKTFQTIVSIINCNSSQVNITNVLVNKIPDLEDGIEILDSFALTALWTRFSQLLWDGFDPFLGELKLVW